MNVIPCLTQINSFSFWWNFKSICRLWSIAHGVSRHLFNFMQFNLKRFDFRCWWRAVSTTPWCRAPRTRRSSSRSRRWTSGTPSWPTGSSGGRSWTRSAALCSPTSWGITRASSPSGPYRFVTAQKPSVYSWKRKHFQSQKNFIKFGQGKRLWMSKTTYHRFEKTSAEKKPARNSMSVCIW